MFKVSEGNISLQLQQKKMFNSFQSLAAENWKERRPKEVLALGMTSEIYLLERVVQVGVVIVTSELRKGGALPSIDL
jgi:hypothetical protein